MVVTTSDVRSKDDIEQGLEHALQRLADAPVISDPFHFAPIQNAFGSSLYGYILDNMPDDDFYDWGAFRIGQEGSRGLVSLNRTHLAKLPERK